ELLLQLFGEARMPQDLGEQAFGRKKQDAEVGRVGRIEVLVADVLRALPDGSREIGGSALGALTVAGIGCIDEPRVVFERKLGVDRKVDDAAVTSARQPYGELDDFARAATRRDVAVELVGNEDLLEKRAELHFAPRSSCLDVGKDFLQIAHAGCERLHLTKSL